MGGKRKAALCAIMAAAALIALCPAPAGRCAGVALRVSPATIVASVRDGDVLGPFSVTNAGSSPVEVEVEIAQGAHDENGVPILMTRGPHEDETGTERGASVTVEPARFHLSPGESAAVRARARVPAGASGGAYPVIVFRGTPTRSDEGGGIGAGARVAVLMLLTVVPGRPGRDVERGYALVALDILQDAPGAAARVIATCENRGATHVDLVGTVTARRQDGSVAAEAATAPGVCLPGCRRALVASLPASALGAGAHVAEVRVRDLDGNVEAAVIAFTVGEARKVVAAHLDLDTAGDWSAFDERDGSGRAVASVAIPAVSSGSHLPVEVRIENAGDRVLEPVGFLEIWDYHMRRVGLLPFGAKALAPGARAVIRLTFPGPLPAGYYTARATLQGAQGSERQRSASIAFVVGAREPGNSG